MNWGSQQSFAHLLCPPALPTSSHVRRQGSTAGGGGGHHLASLHARRAPRSPGSDLPCTGRGRSRACSLTSCTMFARMSAGTVALLACLAVVQARALAQVSRRWKRACVSLHLTPTRPPRRCPPPHMYILHPPSRPRRRPHPRLLPPPLGSAWWWRTPTAAAWERQTSRPRTSTMLCILPTWRRRPASSPPSRPSLFGLAWPPMPPKPARPWRVSW